MNVAGNWTNNGGSFTPGTTTVSFNGVSQAIAGSSSTGFYTLAIAGGSTTTGTTAPTATNFNIDAGGKYIHTAATSVVPGTNKNFDAASTYEYQGTTGTFPSVSGISFGNLIINTPSGDNNANGRLTTVQGNLIIQSTGGGGSFRLAETTSPVVNITGNLQIDAAGKLHFSSSTGNPVVNVSG